MAKSKPVKKSESVSATKSSKGVAAKSGMKTNLSKSAPPKSAPLKSDLKMSSKTSSKSSPVKVGAKSPAKKEVSKKDLTIAKSKADPKKAEQAAAFAARVEAAVAAQAQKSQAGSKKPKRGPKLHFANVAKAAAQKQAQKEQALREKEAGNQKGSNSSKPGASTLREPLKANAKQGAQAATQSQGGGKKGKSAPINVFDRLYYIKNWKRIKRKEAILQEGKLEAFIYELLSKYPDKFVEAIRLDLLEDQAFAKVIYDLELEDRDDEVDGATETDVEEPTIDSLKREFEDVETDF